MDIRRWLMIVACAVALLAGLAVSSKSAPAPATASSEAAASEQYRLAAGELGSGLVLMTSKAYALNRHVVLRAHVATPMESEHYRVGGTVTLQAYVPLVLRN